MGAIDRMDRLLSQSKSQDGVLLNVERGRGRDFHQTGAYSDSKNLSMGTVSNSVDGEITLSMAMDNVINTFRNSVPLVNSLRLGVRASGLDVLAKAYERVNGHFIDINHLYTTSSDFKALINAVASGFVVTAGIERVVPNSIKMYYKTAKDGNSNLLSVKANKVFMGTLPCITAFDEASVNEVQNYVSTISMQVRNGLSLFDFVNTSSLKRLDSSVVPDSSNLVTDSVLFRNMDVQSLAEYIMVKFPDNVDDGLALARANGTDENKLQRTSLLMKAVKDYSTEN